jgi:multimeric flavodoxin WrbA
MKFYQVEVESMGELLKALALVVSGREKGNCYDFAHFVLEQLENREVRTELINFYDQSITPCHCAYECLLSFDPQRGVSLPCPIDDDVQTIWKKTRAAHILLIFVPTYGGLPPAVWTAYVQRLQPFLKEIQDTPDTSVVSTVVLASPHLSLSTEWTPCIMADEIKHMGRIIAVFEVINTAGFGLEPLFNSLLEEEEIQRRLTYLAERTLTIARERCNDG